MHLPWTAAALACSSLFVGSAHSLPAVTDNTQSMDASSTTASVKHTWTPTLAAIKFQMDLRKKLRPPPIKESDKYFHENRRFNHYDARYFSHDLPEEERQLTLRALMQTFLIFTQENRIESWLMHGTLLGWHWNKRILPWDSDADMMVMEPDMKFLASYHNMTLHHFDLPYDPATDNFNLVPSMPQVPMRRDTSAYEEDVVVSSKTHCYLLDINPGWSNGSITDRANAIDARWIDTATGMYIDLTTLRPNHDDPEAELHVKDRHNYQYSDIFPLRKDTYEGVTALVPAKVTDVLAEEYGEDCLTNNQYRGHQFDYDKQLWQPAGKIPVLTHGVAPQFH